MKRLPLADELFLVGHDQYTGKPQISDGALDSGLAGAILGELVFGGRVTINDETVVVVRDPNTYGEGVTDVAIAEIGKQRQSHPVRAWVEYLRDSARTMVGERVIRSGLVQRVESRGLLRQSVRYQATDTLRAASPQARLRYVVDHPEFLDVQTAVLAGLVLATGLDYLIGGGSPREIQESLTEMMGRLGRDLHALVVGVESAVAQLALSAHR